MMAHTASLNRNPSGWDAQYVPTAGTSIGISTCEAATVTTASPASHVCAILQGMNAA